MSKLKVGIINLGCDKNRVDSEVLLKKLSDKYEMINEAENADILIVNTCGFIEASKQESINTILEMARYKEKNCKVLIGTGCLTQRYGSELLELMPELDGILGVNDYDKIERVIEEALKNDKKLCFCNYSDTNINTGDRILTTGTYSAYLRISEGCDNACAYCAIPKIRGKYRSRDMESILKEAELLAEGGVKEIILVAQDSTRYGIDIYGEKKLHELVRRISEIKSLKWIRIMYCYAEEITEDIIKEIAENEKVCNYLDIPLQHISDEVLKNMRRRGRRKLIEENIKKLRDNIPNLCLRTSLIVGFPGESEENFRELMEFVEKTKIDKLGVFKYSREEGTAAFDMDNQIDDEVKEIREAEIMFLQQRISKEINEKKIGKVYNVIVDEFDGERYHGRSCEMAPEIDGEVIFTSSKKVEKGQFVNVKITEALEYDLIGVEWNESSK